MHGDGDDDVMVRVMEVLMLTLMINQYFSTFLVNDGDGDDGGDDCDCDVDNVGDTDDGDGNIDYLQLRFAPLSFKKA